MTPNRIKARQHAVKVLKELKITEPPVDLKLILKRHDIEVKSFDESKLRTSGKVSAFLDQQNYTIYFNRSHHRHRIRFSIAHELGHYFMAHKTTMHSHDYDNKSIEELEADMFAAELLMPFKWLKKDKLNGMKIPEMSLKYGVSELALGVRMSQSNSLLGTKAII